MADEAWIPVGKAPAPPAKVPGAPMEKEKAEPGDRVVHEGRLYEITKGED